VGAPSPSALPSPRQSVRIALAAPSGEILRSPACVASRQLCPGSSGVWLRQAEKAVLGAGGRGVVSSAISTLSVLRSGGKERLSHFQELGHST